MFFFSACFLFVKILDKQKCYDTSEQSPDVGLRSTCSLRNRVADANSWRIAVWSAKFAVSLSLPP